MTTNFKNNVFTVTSDDKKIDDPYYARLVKKEVETNSFETNFSEYIEILQGCSRLQSFIFAKSRY